jgi:ankyrin repeat protein
MSSAHTIRNLIDAAREANLEVVQARLANGESPNQTSINGKTPLHKAAYRGHFVVVEALLAKGANPNEKNIIGKTPLHEAAYGGHFAIVQALLANGANPNDQCLYGSTPLYVAAFHGHREAVEALLADNQTDPRLPDLWGETAARAAEREGHADISTTIQARIAEKDRQDRRWSPLRAAWMGTAARLQVRKNGSEFGSPSPEIGASALAGGGSAGALDEKKDAGKPDPGCSIS